MCINYHLLRSCASHHADMEGVPPHMHADTQAPMTDALTSSMAGAMLQRAATMSCMVELECSTGGTFEPAYMRGMSVWMWTGKES